jgi:protein-S-isoprenylcysteine O-methyltransferase Ste14
MAEAEVRHLLLWGAELADLVPPVSPVGKAVGTVFAVGIVVASLYLVRRQHQIEGPAPNTLAAPGPWRLPIAWLMAGCGVLFLVGVWIDPQRHVNLFVLVWFVLLVAIVVLLCAAGVDLLVVRRRAHQEWASLERQRRRLEEELKARQRF